MKTAHMEDPVRAFTMFVGLALAISAPFVIIGAMTGTRFRTGPGLPISALQFVAPLIAAVILSVRAGGWPAARELFSRTVRLPRKGTWRRSVHVVVTIPTVYAVAAGVMSALGRPIALPEIRVTTVLLVPLLFLAAAFCEEVGWTSFALRPAHRRWGNLAAALIIGMIWALWHVPADLQNGHPAAWIVPQRLGSVVLRVLLVWAYLSLGRTAVGAIVVHTLDNTCWFLLAAGGTAPSPLLVTAITGIATTLCIAASGGARRRGTTGDRARTPLHRFMHTVRIDP